MESVPGAVATGCLMPGDRISQPGRNPVATAPGTDSTPKAASPSKAALPR